MKEERAIELLEYLKGSEVGNGETGIALDMAISSLCRQEQLIRALHEMSVKYAEMYLDTEPDTEDHILDRVRYCIDCIFKTRENQEWGFACALTDFFAPDKWDLIEAGAKIK